MDVQLHVYVWPMVTPQYTMASNGVAQALQSAPDRLREPDYPLAEMPFSLDGETTQRADLFRQIRVVGTRLSVGFRIKGESDYTFGYVVVELNERVMLQFWRPDHVSDPGGPEEVISKPDWDPIEALSAPGLRSLGEQDDGIITVQGFTPAMVH